ncbi:transport ATP-binding protein cydD [Streptomyces laurentii]|uniref:Transport ATP-binding protein cydD n=1 Tax=Streptomyces laurentii TaxID=39478 RepID=A0A160P8E3_STRLU|nr:transport ATP-binding protein cydD [Streptomyces laurentii]
MLAKRPVPERRGSRAPGPSAPLGAGRSRSQPVGVDSATAAALPGEMRGEGIAFARPRLFDAGTGSVRTGDDIAGPHRARHPRKFTEVDSPVVGRRSRAAAATGRRHTPRNRAGRS